MRWVAVLVTHVVSRVLNNSCDKALMSMLNTEHFMNGQGSHKFEPFHHHQPHLTFTKPKKFIVMYHKSSNQ